MLYGFYGYDQIMVHPDDQEKTTFTTPWGTFNNRVYLGRQQKEEAIFKQYVAYLLLNSKLND
jgi:hypothetical protein